MRKIALTVLSWNRAGFLRKTLDSLLLHNADAVKEMRCIVLDNGSLDESRDFLNSLDMWDEKIYLEENIGFGAGTTQLLESFLKTDCDYLLHLENDWECLRGGWIEESIDFLDSLDDVGFVRLSGRHVPYLNHNSVSKERLQWTEEIVFGDNFYKISNGHYTTNPALLKRSAVEKIVPMVDELEGQGKYFKTGLRIGAMVRNQAFMHIQPSRRTPEWKR